MREFKLEFINKYTIFKDILKNIWVIILAAVIGFFGVRAYYNFTYKPVYSSSTTIAISATASGTYSYSNLGKTIEAAATFQEMFQSSYFREKLASLTNKEITGTITASQIEETNLIIISYSCDSPVDAYTVLVAVIENYNAITDHSFENMIINTIVEPSVPIAPSNTVSYNNYDIIAMVGFAVIVLALIVLLSFFRDTVKNETDVDALLDAKLFGVVYHEEKNKTLSAKMRFSHSKDPLMITDILINYRFAEAFRIMTLKLEYLMHTKNLKTLMVTSCGENEGKSTVSVNIALAMASAGKKTLLVDADLRKPAVYKYFSDKSDSELQNVGEIIKGKVNISNAIIKDKKSDLYVLCGHQKYRNSSEILSTQRFERLIESLRDQFDFIVFDTSPTSLVADAEIIASNMDGVVIVVRQDIAPVPEINDMIDAMNQAGTSVVGCVFNDVHVLPFEKSDVSEKNGHYYDNRNAEHIIDDSEEVNE